jgi:hypothetical protein
LGAISLSADGKTLGAVAPGDTRFLAFSRCALGEVSGQFNSTRLKRQLTGTESRSMDVGSGSVS